MPVWIYILRYFLLLILVVLFLFRIFKHFKNRQREKKLGWLEWITIIVLIINAIFILIGRFYWDFHRWVLLVALILISFLIFEFIMKLIKNSSDNL